MSEAENGLSVVLTTSTYAAPSLPHVRTASSSGAPETVGAGPTASSTGMCSLISCPTRHTSAQRWANGTPFGSFHRSNHEYMTRPFAPHAMHCQHIERSSASVGARFFFFSSGDFL